MRKTIATALLFVGTTGAVLAADLPSRVMPVYAPPLPVFTWSGGYFGINAGYAFDYNSRFHTLNNTASEAVGGAGGTGVNRPTTVDLGSDGFTGGGQVGYNYQFGAGSGIVVGVEADAAYTDLGQTNSYLRPVPTVATTALSTLHSDMDFLGTVRGRVGYAFDRFLIYGTGGFAFGDVSQKAQFYSGTAATAATRIYSGSRSSIDTGYAYGGGVEYAMPTDSFLNVFHSSAVTIKAEYLHYDLGTSSLAVNATGNGGTGSYTQRIKTDGDLARIGLNYKF